MKTKDIGISTALILCIVAVFVGYGLLTGDILGFVSVEGRGWADTMGSFLFALIFVPAIYFIAFMLITIGSIGCIIIMISLIAAQLNKSITAEEHPMVKWALSMLTVKKLLQVTVLFMVSAIAVYWVLDSVGGQLSDDLRDAIIAEDIESAESLLKKSWIIELENQFNLSFAFNRAIKTGNKDLVQLFINDRRPIRMHHIETAVEQGHIDVALLLLESEELHIDVNISEATQLIGGKL